MNVLLPRISILVASTKTIGSHDCFFFQDRMHNLLDLTREFSLVLLCSAGSEACPGELKDARFWPVRAKLLEFTEGTFHYLDVQVILHQ
jgi:hypothetical protein